MTAVQLLAGVWPARHPAAWIVVCAVLAALTVALVVLLRTRWQDVSPWRKCALLSLWVHIVLACLATTVRIVSGSPGLGDNPPMRVSIIDDAAHSVEQPLPSQPSVSSTYPRPATSDAAGPTPDDPGTAAAAAKEAATAEVAEAEALEAAADSLTASESEVELPPTSPTEPDAPPELLPTVLDETAAQPTPLDADPAEADVPEAASAAVKKSVDPTALEQREADLDANANPETPNAVAQSLKSPALGADGSPADEPTPHAQAEASAGQSVPAAYADRFSPDREQLVVRRGGNARSERAVKSALAWLAASQSPDGRWDAARHGSGEERAVLGQNRSRAGVQADAGVTGLALLAFLGAGHTHQQGSYAETVDRGLSYFKSMQLPNGALFDRATLFARMYCHSMAAFAAAEAYAITGDQELKALVQRAVAYSLSMQHPTDGGWRYAAGQTGDTSQLGWKLMALKSASLGGLDAPQATWSRVDRFLRRVQRGAQGGLAVYRPEEVHPSPAMTAEALLCRLLVNEKTGGRMSPAAVREAIDSLLSNRPNQRELNLYYWYYGTMALASLRGEAAEWNQAWQNWNESLAGTLLATQQSDGSWPDSTVWGGYGGRVYTTALAALCLEGYYRYAPLGGTGDHGGPHGAAVARGGGRNVAR